ncbi:MAG TPA: Crp/Fnr family transcriptional regulator [Polyangiaceae bacterium LLY-WYZ-15_(1-7)]|nr:cyclic nucleotide-binding protein [Myxococcales bacterium]MAT26927.1 cyclic nucleotide-binding protein [Sandaracinus sp.]HJK92435.1 Crp/Fnr family transcriptional regulator [Polyangiaceae bacterium LLY-WYZ-15_(1-7)]MBJ70190.1 cyclic nucleotide-binding protein [Sandaracinus sp.]HJL03130.1 Crp/Fnr family transcriptional regulator [Polyangiaceae bacterium LLY-WYZ-15_(1-7)]
MTNEKLAKRVQQVPEGTVLFRDGDRGDEMYVIQRGRVRIFTEVKGREKLLAILGPGDFFGEMAILNDKPRTASAEVVEDAQLLSIDPKTFGAMIVSNTEIAVRLIKKLARRLDSANTLIDLLMHRDPKARTILGLAHEAEYNGQRREDGSVVVPLDRGGLANQIGLSADEVSTVLQRLGRLKIVEETAEGFRIPDVMRLHEFLEFLQMREKFGDE